MSKKLLFVQKWRHLFHDITPVWSQLYSRLALFPYIVNGDCETRQEDMRQMSHYEETFLHEMWQPVTITLNNTFIEERVAAKELHNKGLMIGYRFRTLNGYQ